MQKRVVVTGLGIISPIGNNVDAAWQACRQGQSGIGHITRFDASEFRSHIAGEVKNFELPSAIEPKEAKKMDLFIQYGIAAAQQALEDSGLVIDDALAPDVGVSMGVGVGGQPAIEKSTLLLAEKGPSRLSPFFIPMMLPNMASGFVSLTFGTKGYNACTLSACASSNHAIGEGFRLIQRGDAKAMFVGGTEGSLTSLCLGGFAAMRALSTRNDEPEKASRPYDKDRDGFVFSEGSGMLILEEYEHAVARGAKIYCELTGFGFSSDAYHISSPSVEGPALAIARTLKDAGVDPSEVDYVNAHATSTPAGDTNELKAIRHALGAQAADKVSVSATKSMTGHLLGAAGAVEAVFAIKAMQDNFVPPTINVDNLDPEVDMDVTPNEGRERELNTVLSNSFGFSGTNASLLFQKLK